MTESTSQHNSRPIWSSVFGAITVGLFVIIQVLLWLLLERL